MMCAVSAQELTKGESALVYYSPKTTLSVDFTYTVRTQEMGPYARYAKSLLGVEAIHETKSVCTITDVKIVARAETDYARPHKVQEQADVPNLLSINERGLLVGYNIPAPEKQESKPQNPDYTKSFNRAKKEAQPVAPFSEDVLEAGTEEAKAQAVVKQILHLREIKTYLLSGELENAPKDGEGIKQVLAELDKEEAQLTELFTGTTSQRVEKKSIRIVPDAASEEKTQEELCFFSQENGFTDGENIDADTIRVRLTLHPKHLAEPPVLTPKEEKQAKKNPAPQVTQIVYNLPGHAEVQVVHKDHVIGSRTLPVAQLGVDVPLAKDLFSGNELPKIIFSEKTGNIVSISK